MIALVASKLVLVGVAALIFVSLVTFVYFILCANKFVRTVKTLSGTDDEITRRMTDLVKIVCIQASVALILASIATVAFTTSMIGQEERLAPGDFNVAILFRDASVMSALYLFTIIAWYVNSVIEGAFLTDDHQFLCYLFALWDEKN